MFCCLIVADLSNAEGTMFLEKARSYTRLMESKFLVHEWWCGGCGCDWCHCVNGARVHVNVCMYCVGSGYTQQCWEV